MRLSQILVSILSLAITSLALPVASPDTVEVRQNLPSAIFPSPPNSQPANSVLVQVGFSQSLNYNFVSSNSQSQAQIFPYLPQGIAYGLGISTQNVVMESLDPLDTSASLGYITTLARFWIPNGQQSALQIGIRTANSNFYNNPNSVEKSLMGTIDPSISTSA